MERNIEFALLSRRRKRRQAILGVAFVGLIASAALTLLFLPHFASPPKKSSITDMPDRGGGFDRSDQSPSMNLATGCDPPLQQTVLMVESLLRHPVLGLEAEVFSKKVLIDKCSADITNLEEKYKAHVELLLEEYLAFFKSAADNEGLAVLMSIGEISSLNATYESLHSSLMSSRGDAIKTRDLANAEIAQGDFLSGLISLRQLISLNDEFYDFADEVARLATLAEQQVVSNGRQGLAADRTTKSLERLLLDLKAAKSHLGGSRAIDQLETEIKIQMAQNQANELLGVANELVEIGNYTEALVVIKQVLEVDKVNKGALELKIFAEERSSHLDKLKRLISQQARLLDKNIAEYAQKLLKSSSYAEESEVIAEAESKLSALLVWANEMVTVDLVALRPLELEVRGVGYVTDFSNKKIQLKRASYVLFARCNGHSDRRYEIDLTSTNGYRLEVDCGNELR
jgi:hypothetical protein